MWCYCSSYRAHAMVEVGDGSNGGCRFAWCVLDAGNRRSGSVGGVPRLTSPAISSTWWLGAAAPGTAAPRWGPGEGSMPPTADRGGVQVWPRAVDRASSRRRPKIDDLGEGKRRWRDVVGPTSWEGKYGNCWSKLCFRDGNIFTPSPITSYRESNLLHLLKLLLGNGTILSWGSEGTLSRAWIHEFIGRH
jgi:hypothetical protein